MAAYSTIDLESAKGVPASKPQTRKSVGLAVICCVAFLAGASIPSAAKGLSNFAAGPSSSPAWPHEGQGQIKIVEKDWMSYDDEEWCLTAKSLPPSDGTGVKVKKCKDKRGGKNDKQQWSVYDNDAAGNDFAGRVKLLTPGSDGTNYCLEVQCDDLSDDHPVPCEGAKILLKPCSDLATDADNDNQNIVFAAFKGVRDKLKFQALDVPDMFGTYHLCLGTGRESEEKKEEEESIEGMKAKAVQCGDEQGGYDQDIDGDVYWHVDGNFD